jgi:hypothetical protein
MPRTQRTASTLAALALCGALALPASAGVMVELVENGEFEQPALTSGWNPFLNSAVDGWTSTESRIEIWSTSMTNNGVRPNGSDGLPRGQHAEVTWNVDSGYLSTAFLVPNDFLTGSLATFSFDYWNRSSRGIASTVLVNSIAVDSFSGSSPSVWSGYSQGIAGLAAGDAVELRFASQGGGSMGAHIDQVSFRVATGEPIRLLNASSQVPAPAPLALLGLGLAALATRRRKVRHA